MTQKSAHLKRKMRPNQLDLHQVIFRHFENGLRKAMYIIIFAVDFLSCYKYTYDFKTVYFGTIKGRGARGTYLIHGIFLSGLVFRMFSSGNMHL